MSSMSIVPASHSTRHDPQYTHRHRRRYRRHDKRTGTVHTTQIVTYSYGKNGHADSVRVIEATPGNGYDDDYYDYDDSSMSGSQHLSLPPVPSPDARPGHILYNQYPDGRLEPILDANGNYIPASANPTAPAAAAVQIPPPPPPSMAGPPGRPAGTTTTTHTSHRNRPAGSWQCERWEYRDGEWRRILQTAGGLGENGRPSIEGSQRAPSVSSRGRIEGRRTTHRAQL